MSQHAPYMHVPYGKQALVKIGRPTHKPFVVISPNLRMTFDRLTSLYINQFIFIPNHTRIVKKRQWLKSRRDRLW